MNLFTGSNINFCNKPSRLIVIGDSDVCPRDSRGEVVYVDLDSMYVVRYKVVEMNAAEFR
jgi:hypothetical protein